LTGADADRDAVARDHYRVDVVRAHTRHAIARSWRLADSVGVAGNVTHFQVRLTGTSSSSAFCTSAVLPKVRTERPSGSGEGALRSRVGLSALHEDIDGVGLDRSGNDDVGLRSAAMSDAVRVEFATHRDDPTEGALRVGVERLLEGVGERRPNGRARGVGVS